MSNKSKEQEKQIQLKDTSYWRKVKDIARIHYEANPDGIKPELLVKFNLKRNTSRVVRMLIDREYDRLSEFDKSE